MTRAMDEVSRSIGGLEAGVLSLSKQMAAHSKMHSENHEKLTQKMDELSKSVTQMCSKIEQIDNDVNKMKPEVTKLNNARQRMLAIIGVGTVVISGVFNAAIGYWNKL